MELYLVLYPAESVTVLLHWELRRSVHLYVWVT